MPFTFAHPAAVIPLRRYGGFTVLAIGSMVPDAGYFLPWDPPRSFSHGLSGLFLFCLPLGLSAYLLWTLVLREPVRALLPDALACRIARSRPLPNSAADWLRIAAGLLIGATTHLLWDGLTRPGIWVWAALLFPGIADEIIRLGSAITPGSLLQHGSSVLGLGVLALWALRVLRRTEPEHRPPETRPRPAFRTLLTVIGIGVVLGFALIAASDPESGFQGRTLVGRAARAALSALGPVLLAYALGWHVFRRASVARRSGRLPLA
ncbi:MAG: DUF4184 family protein [Panacagrimonas sp.]